MKSNTSSWIAIGLIAAAGFGVGVHQWRRVRALESAREETQRLQRAMLAECRAWERRAVGAERTLRPAEAAPVATASGKNTAPPREADPGADITIAERLQKDPQFQMLHLAVERAQILATYGALFRKLGLSPEKIVRFQEIALQREERQMDLQAIMELRHLPAEAPEIESMRLATATDFASAMRALLGEADYKELQNYERTGWLRQMVAGWAGGAVVAIREPFTAEQGEELVRLMASASASYRRGEGVDMHEPGYWRTVETQARKILSPAQFQLFATMEPPLPFGARYQAQLYAKVQEAIEAEKVPAAGSKPPGG